MSRSHALLTGATALVILAFIAATRLLLPGDGGGEDLSRTGGDRNEQRASSIDVVPAAIRSSSRQSSRQEVKQRKEQRGAWAWITRGGQGVAGCRYEIRVGDSDEALDGVTGPGGSFLLQPPGASPKIRDEVYSIRFYPYVNLAISYKVRQDEIGGLRLELPAMREVKVDVLGVDKEQKWELTVELIEELPSPDINVRMRMEIPIKGTRYGVSASLAFHRLHGVGPAKNVFGVLGQAGLLVSCNMPLYRLQPDSYSCIGGESVVFQPLLRARSLKLLVLRADGRTPTKLRGRAWLKDRTEQWQRPVPVDLEDGAGTLSDTWQKDRDIVLDHEFEVCILLENGKSMRATGVPREVAPLGIWTFRMVTEGRATEGRALALQVDGVKVVDWLLVNQQSQIVKLAKYSLSMLSPPRERDFLLTSSSGKKLLFLTSPGARVQVISAQGQVGSVNMSSGRIEWLSSIKEVFALGTTVRGFGDRVKSCRLYVRLPGTKQDWFFKLLLNGEYPGIRNRGWGVPALPKDLRFMRSQGCLYRLEVHGDDDRSKHKLLLDLIL